VFLVGHSSNWLWEDGKYKNVFANINQLKKNDEIIIRTDDTYIYRVYAKEVVSPNDVSVLKSNSESIISLMTCYPIGTTWKRLIVRAEQVWPASTGDKVENLDLQQIKLLPSIR
jgi:sortase A